MNVKIMIITFLLTISAIATCQTEGEINKFDQQGRKQGHWIKRYPNGNIMYNGIFNEGHPIGEFKRYSEDNTLKSVLNYSTDGKEATAILYHPNGNISSEGTFINQKKEGKWRFFSEFIKGGLMSEEIYLGNLRNGPSIKYYRDSTVAERVNYVNDIPQGECVQYYPNGAICLKLNYNNGEVNGKYEVLFENGQIEFSGQYVNDRRDGIWYIYRKDGTIKYKLEYQEGVTKNRQMDIDESDFLDRLEKNKGKIADPEKTDAMW
jgi:antitoxin component YwqK of YwqJK toxin-antitoxin module